MSEILSNKPGRGGARKGAGRKLGTPNRKTVQAQNETERSGLTPLQFMLQIMRDPAQEDARRLQAASMAAPYVHAKLSTVELSGKDGAPMQTVTRIELVAMTK